MVMTNQIEYECVCGEIIDVTEDDYAICTSCNEVICHSCSIDNELNCNGCKMIDCLKITTEGQKFSAEGINNNENSKLTWLIHRINEIEKIERENYIYDAPGPCIIINRKIYKGDNLQEGFNKISSECS